MTIIKIPIAKQPIGRVKGKDGEEFEVFLTDEFRRVLEQLVSGTGSSTTGFPDADLVGIPSYDIIAQITELNERLLSLEGRIVEREVDSKQELLDLASLSALPGGAGLQGPGASTDNAVARWDGSTGTKLQSSAFIVDDTGHVTSFGGNVKFPAVAVPSADVNTLDDYQELGSLTLTLAFGGASVGVTYDSQFCHVTQIGREVFGRLGFVLTAKGSSVGAATIAVSGLPSAAAVAELFPVKPTRLNLDVVGGYYQFWASLAGTTFSLVEQGDNVADANITNNAFVDTTAVNISFNYHI